MISRPLDEQNATMLNEQIRRAQSVAEMKGGPGWDVVSEWLAKRADALVNELTTAISNDELRMLQGGIRLLKEFNAFVQGTIDKGVRAKASLAPTDKTRVI